MASCGVCVFAAVRRERGERRGEEGGGGWRREANETFGEGGVRGRWTQFPSHLFRGRLENLADAGTLKGGESAADE